MMCCRDQPQFNRPTDNKCKHIHKRQTHPLSREEVTQELLQWQFSCKRKRLCESQGVCYPDEVIGGNPPGSESLETAVTRIRSWYEMAASLRGRELGSRGTSSVGNRYQAAERRPWLRILVCVWLCFVKSSHELCVKVSNKSEFQPKLRL
jgi:hypothetical protein